MVKIMAYDTAEVRNTCVECLPGNDPATAEEHLARFLADKTLSDCYLYYVIIPDGE